MDSGLSFFKVISSSQQMGFPPESVARLQGIVGRRITLRDVHKNLWTVEVERGQHGYFFSKGWSQFYQENSLEPHDVVVFIHNHEYLFDFKLFGHNQCEKKGVGRPIFGVAEEAKEIIVKEEEEEEEEIETEAEEDEEGSAESDEYDGDEEGDDKKEKASSSSYLRQKKKRNVGDYYGHDIFRSGLAIRPSNPYFVSRSRTSRKNELNIPQGVISDLHLKIPSRVFLVDERGREWETKVKKWKDGRLWCTGGWKSMCRVNGIDTNDTCICEFVQGGQHGLYLRVIVVDVADTK